MADCGDVMIGACRRTAHPRRRGHAGDLNAMCCAGLFGGATRHRFARIGLTRGLIRRTGALRRHWIGTLDPTIDRRRRRRPIRSGIVELRDKMIRFAHDMVSAGDAGRAVTGQKQVPHFATPARREGPYPAGSAAQVRPPLVQREAGAAQTSYPETPRS